MCHRPVPFAPGMHPVDQQQLDSLPLPDPHFVPVIPPSPWRWTPWFVVLLGAAIVGSVVAYLVTEDHFWLLAVGIPAVTLLCILSVVWMIFGRREIELPDDFPDDANAEP